MLVVAMAQVRLQRARFGALVGQLKAAGVPQHMGMGLITLAGRRQRNGYDLADAVTMINSVRFNPDPSHDSGFIARAQRDYRDQN
jgi:hypothetical protein